MLQRNWLELIKPQKMEVTVEQEKKRVGERVAEPLERGFGLTLGNALDVRVGLRSTTAFGIKDSKNNDLGTASWMDGILVIGVSL